MLQDNPTVKDKPINEISPDFSIMYFDKNCISLPVDVSIYHIYNNIYENIRVIGDKIPKDIKRYTIVLNEKEIMQIEDNRKNNAGQVVLHFESYKDLIAFIYKKQDTIAVDGNNNNYNISITDNLLDVVWILISTALEVAIIYGSRLADQQNEEWYVRSIKVLKENKDELNKLTGAIAIAVIYKLINTNNDESISNIESALFAITESHHIALNIDKELLSKVADQYKQYELSNQLGATNIEENIIKLSPLILLVFATIIYNSLKDSDKKLLNAVVIVIFTGITGLTNVKNISIDRITYLLSKIIRESSNPLLTAANLSILLDAAGGYINYANTIKAILSNK